MTTNTIKMVRVREDLWSRVMKAKNKEGYTWNRFLTEMFEAWQRAKSQG